MGSSPFSDTLSTGEFCCCYSNKKQLNIITTYRNNLTTNNNFIPEQKIPLIKFNNKNNNNILIFKNNDSFSSCSNHLNNNSYKLKYSKLFSFKKEISFEQYYCKNISNNKSNNDEILYDKLIIDNFFKQNFSVEQIKKLILLFNKSDIAQNKNICNINDNVNLFYLLVEGEIKLYDNYQMPENIEYIKIKNIYSFGELNLLNNSFNVIKKYNITSSSKCKLFILEKQKYNRFLIDENIIIKSIEIKILLQIPLLKFFSNEELTNLSKLSYILENKNPNEAIEIYLTLNDFFNVKISDVNIKKTFLKLDLSANENLIVSIHNLIEIFGMNYKSIIIYRIFKKLVTEEKYYLNINKNIDVYYYLIYQTFKFKFLNKQSSLGIQLKNDNNFIFILLSGGFELYDNKNIFYDYKPFCIIDTKNLKNKTKIIFKLNSIILHIKHNDFEEKLNFINNINLNNNSEFFDLLNDNEKLFFLTNISIKNYKKDEVLISEEKKCDSFYLIINGTVKEKNYNEDKTIHKFSDNNFFGEKFLLSDNDIKIEFYIYVTSFNLTLFELPKKYFFVLLSSPKINELIKNKMCIEENSISNIKNLYYLKQISKTKFGYVYLVHNGIFKYSIKIISIKKLEKNNINSEKFFYEKTKIYKSLNSSFLPKLVTNSKNSEFLFFIYEHFDFQKFFIFDKNNFKFILMNLFIIINYLHQKKIIHRDIKIENLVIDKDNYLKLINFESSKKIHNGYAKTLIGTPHYMAPEIIEGINYSFPCDYYSIGVCIYVMLYNKFPFGNNKNDVYEIYKDIVNNKYYIDYNNNEFNDLISKLLVKDYTKRYSSFDEVKNYNAFSGLDWNLVMKRKIIFNENKVEDDNWKNNFKINFEEFICKQDNGSDSKRSSSFRLGIGDKNNIIRKHSKIEQEIDVLNDDNN